MRRNVSFCSSCRAFNEGATADCDDARFAKQELYFISSCLCIMQSPYLPINSPFSIRPGLSFVLGKCAKSKGIRYCPCVVFASLVSGFLHLLFTILISRNAFPHFIYLLFVRLHYANYRNVQIEFFLRFFWSHCLLSND